MSEITLTPDPRPLGKSGIHVSPIAWGMWRFAGQSAAQGQRLIEAALDAGVTLFDTADIYGFDGSGGFGDAEALLGEVFAAAPQLRDRMVLATKGGITPPVPYDSSPAYLAAALDNSLRRMRVERVELYQIHRPDVLTHPLELAKFAQRAIESGKIAAFGVSNFTPAQTRTLLALMPEGIPLATIQPEISPFEIAAIEDRTLDIAMQHELTPLAWSPLGGGRIAEPKTEREQAVVAALDAVAAKFAVSRATVAYAWLMAHPSRPIPIAGTQDLGRIAELADVFKVRWTRQDWYDVLVAARGEKLP